MTKSAQALSTAQIAERLSSPYGRESLSAISGDPFVMLKLDDPGPIDIREIKHRLKGVPCPVIGISSGPGISIWGEAVDVIAHSEVEAMPMIANIRQHPLAAMILVQLLRHNEGTDIANGLLGESLAYATLQGGQEFKAYLESQAPKPEAPSENAEPAVITARTGDLLELTYNRPKRGNAFSMEIRDGLIEGLHLLASDPSIKKAVVRGRGGNFCTGGDLDEFGLATDTAQAHAIRSTRSAGHLISEHADRIEFHLHGACIGSGVELPAFAAHVVARDNAFFQLPEITLGLIPGAGGTVSILKRIGRHRTARLALSAEKLSAQTALDWGLIDGIE